MSVMEIALGLKEMVDGPSYTTGKEAEMDWFPLSPGNTGAESTGYLPYKDAMKMVKENVPEGWDPSDPALRMSNDFHYGVAEKLGEEDLSKLRFYPAIDTPLDRYHGVDGVFEYDGRTVTVDLTLNRAKENGYKADVVFNPTDEYSMARAMEDIAEKLKPLAVA